MSEQANAINGLIQKGLGIHPVMGGLPFSVYWEISTSPQTYHRMVIRVCPPDSFIAEGL